MKIEIGPDNFDSIENKKLYIASIYAALHKLLSGESMTIEIAADIDLSEMRDALIDLSEIIAPASGILSPPSRVQIDDDDEPEDPDEWWKKGQKPPHLD